LLAARTRSALRTQAFATCSGAGSFHSLARGQVLPEVVAGPGPSERIQPRSFHSLARGQVLPAVVAGPGPSERIQPRSSHSLARGQVLSAVVAGPGPSE
jgi:hypothetical protein